LHCLIQGLSAQKKDATHTKSSLKSIIRQKARDVNPRTYAAGSGTARHELLKINGCNYLCHVFL